MINLATVLMSAEETWKAEAIHAEVARLHEAARRIAPNNPAVLINRANGTTVTIAKAYRAQLH